MTFLPRLWKMLDVINGKSGNVLQRWHKRTCSHQEIVNLGKQINDSLQRNINTSQERSNMCMHKVIPFASIQAHLPCMLNMLPSFQTLDASNDEPFHIKPSMPPCCILSTMKCCQSRGRIRIDLDTKNDILTFQKIQVLYLALLTTEGLLPKSSSAETLDPSTYLASIRYHTIYYAKTTIVGHPTTPILLPAASANCGILGTIQIWRKTCVPNSSFYPTVLQVVSYQKFLLEKHHLRLSRASRPYDRWYPRGILDKCGVKSLTNCWLPVSQLCFLRWSQRNQGPVLRYSPQPPEAFVPPVRQQKHNSLMTSAVNLIWLQ